MYSREEFVDSQVLIDDDPITRARKFLTHRMQSFGGAGGGSWGYGLLTQNRPAVVSNLIGRLPQYVDRLRDVFIESDSASNVIRRWDSPQTLFYLDPPYPDTDQEGYHFNFTMGDMAALVSQLESCEGAVMLSAYGNCDELIPDDWMRFEFDTRLHLNNTGTVKDRKRVEHLWVRLNRVRPRDEIVSLYNSGAYDCYPLGYYDGVEVITPQTRRGQMALL